MTMLPTGTQFAIEHGTCRAVVAEVGATLRSLQVDGQEIFWTYPNDVLPVPWVGTTLVPWPNRIRDGRYIFNEVEYLLPVNEPGAHTALHGLGHCLEWSLTSRTASSVTLATIIYPQLGWGGVVRVEVTHTVADDGLTIDWRASNEGTTPIPFGYGCHPYFAFEPIDEVTITSPFSQQLRLDQRLLPVELGDVTPEADFRQPRQLGDTALDTAFTIAPQGWEVQLTGPERVITVWADEHHRWMQCYTHPNRRAIAIEPMTCGPDAFNEGPTHADLLRLEPGEGAQGTWGVRVS